MPVLCPERIRRAKRSNVSAQRIDFNWKTQFVGPRSISTYVKIMRIDILFEGKLFEEVLLTEE
ncbi:hypothetical protein KIN20_020062 [Parelaphostrongylus tenuis]|uniref:Uncharacterized protein n=1 Tax=Parelaphostrongylus tenuis TaxID=148309 RepID=A0AAD5N2V6_PARTN|nr:hypothetical protein KIN20_020062 [Parelaphostrongylus tenuis]